MSHGTFLHSENHHKTHRLIGIPYGIFSIGLGIVIITSGIDLSVRSALFTLLAGVTLSLMLTDWRGLAAGGCFPSPGRRRPELGCCMVFHDPPASTTAGIYCALRPRGIAVSRGSHLGNESGTMGFSGMAKRFERLQVLLATGSVHWGATRRSSLLMVSGAGDGAW